VHPDLTALLALQEDDAVISGLEERLRDLEGRERALDRDRAALFDALARARGTIEGEERKRRELALKIEEHKALHGRNIATLDAVRKAREATAAMAQIDLTRKILAQEESDLHALAGRIHDMRQGLELQELELSELDEQQQDAREAIRREHESVVAALRDARTRREADAARVSRGMLSKYERIRSRAQEPALYPIRGAACGRCNTAIPLQRRNVIAAGRSIEVCEGCGVLLYAMD
jgi:predicted  nucleic acid-binding Zn-ribbon protein